MITPKQDIFRFYYQSKRYCPVLAAQKGSIVLENTLATALLHD